jgi:glycosyltransferase involved in cell wall biosynthesis
MKILFITSFYSAVRQSIISDNWQPTGMPAIVKLFEGLKDECIEFDNIFISSPIKSKTKTISYTNSMFNNQIMFFQFSKKLNTKFFRNFGSFINSLLVFRKVKSTIKEQNYDVIYVDRANRVAGALLAYSGSKVILRLHGITMLFTFYKSYKNVFLNFMQFFSFRAPYKYIICTEDGTPGKQFLVKYTRSSVPHKILLNGVDKVKDISLIQNISKKPVFLFLGRLSADKGINEFISTIVKLMDIENKFKVVIVGDGDLKKKAETIIKAHKIKNVLFTGSLPHDEVYKYILNCDVYVSLNKLGNLSNTVLEAINAERCLILLKKSITTLRDISTYQFFNDSVLYINKKNIVNDLEKIIRYLISNPEIIKLKRELIKKKSSKILSWRDRVKEEIRIIQKVASND